MTSGRSVRAASSLYAGSITTLIAFLNAGVGFVFQAIIAAQLGVGAFADAFQLTWTIVTFSTVTIFTLVLTLLVPRIQVESTGAVTRGDAVLPVTLGAVLSITQLVVGIATPGELGVLLVWSSPSALLAGLTAMPQAIAYVQHRFILAAIGGVANGVGLVSVALLSPQPTAESLGLALAAGYLVQLVVASIPFLWRRADLVAGRSVPWRVFVGVSAFTFLSKFQPLLERFLTVGIAVGATSILGFGQKTAQGILLVASFGLALTATASLSRHVNAGAYDVAGSVLARTLAATTWLSAFVCAAALPLAWPATVLLFQRGEFTEDDTELVTRSIVLLLPWVFANAVAGVLTNYLYIQRSYVRVIGAALAGIVVTVIATLVVAGSAPTFAVVVASSCGASASMLWSAVLVVRSRVWGPLRLASGFYRPVYWSALGIAMTTAIAFAVSYGLFGSSHLATTLIPLGTAAIALGVSVMWPRFRSGMGELLSARLH